MGISFRSARDKIYLLRKGTWAKDNFIALGTNKKDNYRTHKNTREGRCRERSLNSKSKTSIRV